MKSIKSTLVLVLLGFGLVMANTTFAQATPDQASQKASKQRTQSREQVRDPATSGGQKQKQQKNRNQSGRNEPTDQSQGKGKGQRDGSGQKKGKDGGRG